MKRLGFLFLIVALISCGRIDLHQGLTEQEADEVLVVLSQNGIDANKEKVVSGQETSWKISVKEGELVQARSILVSRNLPRRQELGLSGVYKEKGLIPTPDEQKARFLLALKGEIVNSLQRIPGVIEADIVLNVPTESEFADLDPQKKRPTASVVVRIKDDADTVAAISEGKVQRFVANGVPNLDPNDVTVFITRSDTKTGVAPATIAVSPPPMPGETPPELAPSEGAGLSDLAGLRLDPASIGRFKVYIVSLLGLLVVVSSALLINIIRLNRLKVRLQRGDRGPQSLPGGPAGMIGGGGIGSGVEGTFDVGARRQ